MKRSLIAILAVALFASMAVPAFGAENAQVQAQSQTQTQTQTYAGEECADCTQVQAQVQTQTQARVGQVEDEVVAEADVVAAGDQIQLRTQDKLQDGSCVEVAADAVAAGDQIQLRTQDKLQDGSCDGVPDQVRDRTGVDVETSVVAESDDEPDGWLAKFLYRFKEAFKFTFGRV